MLFSLVLLLVCAGLSAQTFSHFISFQGRLAEPDTGKPHPDGPYFVLFMIYDAETDGTILWQETQEVTVEAGLFSVYLGTVTPFPGDLLTNGDRWLAVQVSGDEEMPERIRLTPSPWAIFAADSAHATEADHATEALHALEADHASEADNADTVDGQHASEFVSYPLDDNCVYSNNIVDLQVKEPDLDDSSVSTGKMQDDAVDVDKLAHNINATGIGFNADMVDGYHGVDFVVYPLKDNCVFTNNITDREVKTADLDDGAVTTPKFASSAKAPYAGYADDSDRLDGYHAGNGSGQIPISNGTKCSNLHADVWDSHSWGDLYPDADKVDGYHAGNSSGQVAVSNGTKCSSLHADVWDSHSWGDLYPDADKLDGYHYNNLPYAPQDHDHAGEYWSGSGTVLQLDGGVGGLYGFGGDYGVKGFGGDYGVYGEAAAYKSYGLYAMNTASDGTGLLAKGNNQPGQYMTAGSGVAGTGYKYGVFGYARASGSEGQAGGYFQNASGNYAHVAYKHTNGNEYKVIGSGSVSTVVQTTQGARALICPESPEAWFEDFGTAELVDGYCRVELDPLFFECVTINGENPLMVFVQMTSSLPNGFYVAKDSTGFEVIEENGGSSNATFDYRIVAKRAGWEGVRFDPMPAHGEPTMRSDVP